MFTINTPRRVYYLAAETEDEMSTWVDLVCRVCGLHNYGQDQLESVSGQEMTEEATAAPVTSQPARHVSGPYMHLSECFTGDQLTVSRSRRTSAVCGSTSTCVTTLPSSRGTLTSSMCEDEESFTAGDDSVFLPSSPAAAVRDPSVQLSQLTLSSAAPAAPDRPPKPANLRNLQLSHSTTNNSDNYENHEHFTDSNNHHAKVETNNNCDNTLPSYSAQFQPPTVDRRLKPEKPGLNSPSLTISGHGPPVERSRKPSRMMPGDTSATFPGSHHCMSIPGHESTGWADDGSGGSDVGSSDEQIYFYMPSIQTSQPGLAPIMIPASELRDNAVQYLDLDFPQPRDASLIDTSFNEPMIHER